MEAHHQEAVMQQGDRVIINMSEHSSYPGTFEGPGEHEGFVCVELDDSKRGVIPKHIEIHADRVVPESLTLDEVHQHYAVILDHLTEWGRHDLHPIRAKPDLGDALTSAGKLYKDLLRLKRAA